MRSMTIGESVSRVISNYATFSGRARRSEYWWWTLSVFVLMFVLSLLRVQSLFILVWLAIIVPSLAVACRRLHDTGRSGWLQLIVLIPLIGALVLLVFTVQDSQRESNQYGPSPKYSDALAGGAAPGIGFAG